MRKMQRLLGNLLLAGLLSGAACAVVAEEGAKEAAGAEKARAAMTSLLEGTAPDSVQPSPVPGLFEVMVGPRVFYVSEDGRFLVQGAIIDIEKKENLTEPRKNQARLKAVESISEENMIVFGDKDAKHTITVFTDIDCGYCRKLHGEMEAYNKAGIRVRYLFYPRAGLDSPSFKKAVSVWCAEDRNAAMTQAKAGQELPEKTCDNPVEQHLAVGELIGVTGTPALILEDGELAPGYVPADRLSVFLEMKKAGLE
jgi:thiol:disulfide interchange protein DsbC